MRKLNRANSASAKAENDGGNKELAVDYAAELEKRVSSSLGRRVKIVEGGKTKKIELYYSDNDDLDVIITALCGAKFTKQ